MSQDLINPYGAYKQREKETETMGEVGRMQYDAIIKASEIAAESFDKATQISNDQFEKVFAIISPEIKMRQNVMKDIQKEISGEFKGTETGKFETKILERGLAKRGLQKSGVAVEGLSNLAAREAERNLSRKYTFAGLTGGTQMAGIRSLTNLGNTLSSFALGSGQAQAQGLQSAAASRGNSMMNMMNLNRQHRADENAASTSAGLGIASLFMTGE